MSFISRVKFDVKKAHFLLHYFILENRRSLLCVLESVLHSKFSHFQPWRENAYYLVRFQVVFFSLSLSTIRCLNIKFLLLWHITLSLAHTKHSLGWRRGGKWKFTDDGRKKTFEQISLVFESIDCGSTITMEIGLAIQLPEMHQSWLWARQIYELIPKKFQTKLICEYSDNSPDI